MITSKQYRKITNNDELKKSKTKLRKKFNKYIVLRDLTKNETTGEIFGFCIACGKKIEVNLFGDKSIANGRQMHASHYFNTDKYPGLEFCEENVHLSCGKCNSPYGLHGNKEHYQPNLVKKLGKKKYDYLIQKSKQVIKLDILEVDRMIFEYGDKVIIEARRLGIKHY